MPLLNKTCVAENEHWMVPQPVNSLFTGRSKLIARIQSAIRTDDPSMTKQKRLVITGMGGMGKSEVCLRIANEMRQE
jgi:Mrp family chromosome partitioning ATPase